MVPTVTYVATVFLAIFITGWTGDTATKYSRDTPAHSRADTSSWRSTLLSVIEPVYDGDCGCGMDMVDDNRDTVSIQSQEPFQGAVPKQGQDTNNHNGHSVFNQNPRDNADTFKQKFDKKSRMMESFLEDFDLLFLLTSSFQIYLIFKMVSGKGFRRTHDEEESLRFTNTLGLLLHEDHLADKFRTEREELAKTIEYLNRKCAEEDEKLKQKDEEIEQLKKTIIGLQDSFKTSSATVYKGSKFCFYPSFTDLYKFQVPIDDSIFEDEPLFDTKTDAIKGKELFISRTESSWEY